MIKKIVMLRLISIILVDGDEDYELEIINEAILLGL